MRRPTTPRPARTRLARTSAALLLSAALLFAPGCDSADGEPRGQAGLALEDVNPSSPTFGQTVAPEDLLGRASAWYFTRATCPYCTRQYGILSQLAADWADAHPDRPLIIVAVNHDDARAGLDTLVSEGDLPILQDTAAGDLWGAWEVTWRDLIVLDPRGERVGVLNLTEHDLADEEHLQTLEALLLEATEGQEG